MSKNISIKEGGVGQQFVPAKLKMTLVSGGTCLWVPEDEVKLTTLNITEDGIYEPPEGFYGFSRITVKGIGKTTGTDGSGDDVETGTDPSGQIVVSKLPSTLEIYTLPHTLEYNGNASLVFSGLQGRLFMRSGNVFVEDDENYHNGIVPLEKLTLPVTGISFNSPGGRATCKVLPSSSTWYRIASLDSEVYDGPREIWVKPHIGTYTGEYYVNNTKVVLLTYTENGKNYFYAHWVYSSVVDGSAHHYSYYGFTNGIGSEAPTAGTQVDVVKVPNTTPHGSPQNFPWWCIGPFAYDELYYPSVQSAATTSFNPDGTTGSKTAKENAASFDYAYPYIFGDKAADGVSKKIFSIPVQWSDENYSTVGTLSTSFDVFVTSGS